MKRLSTFFHKLLSGFWNRLGFGIQTKLILIFLLVKVIPLLLLAFIAWREFFILGDTLKKISVNDSKAALNDSAVENIERMTTDTARRVADFLYGRDADILYLAGIEPSEENYRQFAENKQGRLVKSTRWSLAPDGKSWISPKLPVEQKIDDVSTNHENNDMDGFHYRPPDELQYVSAPLYDEITFVDLNGNELIKIVASLSPKINYPMSADKKNVSKKENTYVKAETYFNELIKLKSGDIYVSDVIGAYVGSNYIGMYAPSVVADAAAQRGYEIAYDPEKQAYAGAENPNGQRFEGIVRWAAPATDKNGKIIGYVTFALNHDHIMEFVDHQTPMHERYRELPSAFEGNYAFIWDYQSRNICHPRHHSIVGFDPETGDPQIPWLESSIYDAWQASSVQKWMDFIKGRPIFDRQSRDKAPAAALTRAGLVGLDGRYLNNAPQCTGWMDLTKDGGSGSFYIVWSGLYKLTTAAAIPYYTGQYAPSEVNNFSRRGFGFVAIGAGLEDFTHPSQEIETKLGIAINNNLIDTTMQLVITTFMLIVLVVLVAVWMASFLAKNITKLINGISRFRAGEHQFRFNESRKDEFGALADSFDDMADSIVDSVNNPLSITDMKRRIIYMNRQALEATKLSLEEAVGSFYSDSSVYPANTKYCPIAALEEGREAEAYYLEDSDRYVKGVANYFMSKDSRKIGYIIISTDVTEIIREQLMLEQAVYEANLANEHKSEFLARMSHEIRTPMNAIIGVTNIVQKKLEDIDSDVPEMVEIKDNVHKLEVSSKHLLSLLNDILDLSKIEAGKIELSEEKMELSRLADTVAGLIRQHCNEKNITFETVFDSFSPPTFIGDSLRLRQVLINLLGNAVKFTPECGKIEFRVEKKERRDGRTLVRFSVHDTGIGIPDEALETVFQAFEQVDGKMTRQYGGTGLGLAISARIVQLFGGEINVQSKVGEGSEFSFDIWLRETQSAPAGIEEIVDTTGKFTGKRMLLVDDVEINRMIVVSMLEDSGISIDEADNGLSAVEMFKSSDEHTYDIILMDVQMPAMDGYEASAAIRALERSDAGKVPIIALTANAFKEDIDKALRHGMNAHIAKPLEIDKLLTVLFRFLFIK